ncbi:MAG: tol-pal system protein YbgF [Candidatus Binatia bacterium]
MAGLILSACAPPQQLQLVEREQRHLRAENARFRKQNTSVRREVENVRSDLADTRANVEQLRRDLNVLKEKLAEARYLSERQIGQSTRDRDQRIGQLESRIATMDEELKNQGTLLKAREEELRLIREAVLQKTPVSSGTEETKKPSGNALPPKEIGQEKPAAGSDAVKKDYEEARKLLEQKDYRGAIARFKEFLKKHPKNDYSDNAQYWIGESHYALKEFDQAILEFDTVRRNYPEGDKVPASLLKLGFAFAELGDKVDARLILQKLIDRYPQSSEVVKAKQKLKALES